MTDSMGSVKRPADGEAGPAKKLSPARALGASAASPGTPIASADPELLRIKEELKIRQAQLQEMQGLLDKREQREHEAMHAGQTQGRAQGDLEGYERGRAETVQEAKEVIYRERTAS